MASESCYWGGTEVPKAKLKERVRVRGVANALMIDLDNLAKVLFKGHCTLLHKTTSNVVVQTYQVTMTLQHGVCYAFFVSPT